MESDKFEFFEQGYDGFARQLPENCVEYILVVLDEQLEARQLFSALGTVRKPALQVPDRLAGGYIWQRDALQLELKSERGLVYLHGSSHYGDAVEDEWLIVYLLRELTKSFDNLWVRVFDSDGEFLLVEAANVLPSWLSPEIDTNRTWVSQGKLHIIPLPPGQAEKSPLSLEEAVGHLKATPGTLIHSPFIEAEAFYRLEKYPQQITESMHHALVTVPRKLAYMLHKQPAAISPAVEAFYLRDPVSMKHLVSPSSKLRFPPQDLVTLSVKFTKVLFAQLKSQRFSTPPAWAPLMELAESETTAAEESRTRFVRLEMGVKLTSGFEMLASSADKKNSRVAREFAILLQDVEEDGDEALPTDAVIQSWPEAGRDDNESWMDINFEDFENELNGKREGRKHKQAGFGDASVQADLQKIVSRFESFLNDGTAGPEGAELGDMDEDDDMTDSDDTDFSEDEDKEISFDEEQFSKMMREMMGMPTKEETTQRTASASNGSQLQKNVESGSEDEEEEINQLTAQMQAELNSHGALQLEPKKQQAKALKEKRAATVLDGSGKAYTEADAESGDEEIDIDYNLAKNLLESFKSQGGTAGPAGNILGMMGMRLPRDDEDEA